MLGWRARIGNISGTPVANSQERDSILPEGVVWVHSPLGVGRLVPEEFERVFGLVTQRAEALAEWVDFINISGAAIWHHIGYEKSLEMTRRVEKATGLPTILNLTAVINALNRLSARKIILANPFVKERNEEGRKFLEDAGFDVINVKGLGIESNVEISKLPPYASYRVAMEAFRETPEADVILIHCPLWPVVANIAPLEKDTGKPVVTSITAEVWSALTALHIKGPIRGYGTLLEML